MIEMVIARMVENYKTAQYKIQGGKSHKEQIWIIWYVISSGWSWQIQIWLLRNSAKCEIWSLHRASSYYMIICPFGMIKLFHGCMIWWCWYDDIIMMMMQLCKVEGNSVGNGQTAFRVNLIPHSVPQISLRMRTMLTMLMTMMMIMTTRMPTWSWRDGRSICSRETPVGPQSISTQWNTLKIQWNTLKIRGKYNKNTGKYSEIQWKYGGKYTKNTVKYSEIAV